jgi:hypothetical protein
MAMSHVENKDHPVKRLFRNSLKEDRGDILIRGLWSRGTDCIIDVRITDVDAKLNTGEGVGSPRKREEEEIP